MQDIDSNCCEVNIEKCDTFDFMANIIGLPVLHPGGFKATDKMAQWCNVNQNTKVLDVACGKGTNACYIAEIFGCSVVGIDINDNLVRQAKELAIKKGLKDKVIFKVANAEEMPFANNEFDITIFQAVLIMVNNQKKAIEEAIRVTKPGGSIGILELTWKSQPTKSFLKEAIGFCSFFKNAKTSDEWRRLIFTNALKETKFEIFNMECPCGLKELGIIKAISIYFKQILNSRIKKRTQEMDSFMTKNDAYFGYGIYIGEK